MAIKTITALADDLADGQVRAITAAKLRDVLDSLVGIGGTLHGTDLTQAVTANWAAFTAFDGSVATKGLTAASGAFTVGAGADGTYAVDATVSLSAPANGRLDVALTKNGALTPYRAAVTVVANAVAQFNICGTGELAAGDVIGLAVKGSGSATLTVASSQFRAVRI